MADKQLRNIPYTRPSITETEVAYATDAARNGWGDHCYDYIIRFEEVFKAHLDVKYAIATSSCTGALHMGMHALGIGPGDEVIMADTNWVATAAPIVHLGATPVFVDILQDSWCLDPQQVEAAITSNTKAIVAVHLYGNLCDMDALLKIGERHGIPVIEDAAEAIGSVYHGKRAGSMGSFGAFSFHGTKTMTTGEGGIFVTNQPDLYERVLTLSNHGRSRAQGKQFWPDLVGYKYKMSNVQAAIGCGQIQRIDCLIEAKRNIFLMYYECFKDLPVRMNPEPEGCTNGFWMPTLVVEDDIPFERDVLISELKQNGVDARVFFWPLSATPVQGRKAFNRRFISENIYLRALNLPSFHDLTDSDILFVSDIVRNAIARTH
ncbi:DegT/DnrJ/EryC1/StrS family aminotransferase [Cyanobium gracile]|uniref:Putative PLP-dependent enzyme possibly involved in cell wall biogenesis n=1 Tax=Cyanobium gracile (strain ATCC 27147 / PCC 6307) TaxID=292564 RepID=K9P7M0_CYAGP|nr:DegT/DnrJ/EryC1/StrS aminotransferase family protein [Cyanobium gracile]AFY29377.1 putative PLP-dependent enzyme possibly involved in cell wall biogenesis [Cyanobium gracile PCC 6307]